MSEAEEIQEHYAVPEYWCDGSGDHYVTRGVVKFTYFSMQRVPGLSGLQRVAILKIAHPVACLEESHQRLKRALVQSGALEGLFN